MASNNEKPLSTSSSNDTHEEPKEKASLDVEAVETASVSALASDNDAATAANAMASDVEKPADLEKAETTGSGVAYSIYTRSEKFWIVVLAAIGTFFSPFSANIYFAALNPLAADLHVSSSLINLSLTTYLIFQGISPAFMGSFADRVGRRPAFLASFLIYIGANIGLALQDSFAALLVLRCVQSAGISSTVALGFGVAADVAPASERGAYLGWMSSGAMLGPAVGPTIGALLAQFLDWRALFWFLTGLGGLALIVFAVCFPETARDIVGNGSRPPQWWNRTLWSVVARKIRGRKNGEKEAADEELEPAKTGKLAWPNPLACLRVVAEKDVGLLLLFNSLVYTAFYDVTASVPVLFAQTYRFNELQIGLSYLPYGAGVLLAPIITGRLTDWNFRRLAARHGVTVRRNRATDLAGLPIERVRIALAVPMVLAGAAATLAYGWAMDASAPLAAPLVLLFLIGLFLCGGFTAAGVMFVDYYPESPATATAANNLCRCLMGAAGTAIINIMIDKMGRGWCYTFIALVVMVSCAIPLVLLRYGPTWREERRVRVEKKAQLKEAKAREKDEAEQVREKDEAEKA